jgi:hypothetical protein
MQTIQKQSVVPLETCPADLAERARRTSVREARRVLRQALAQAAVVLEKRHPDWYRSLFDLSLFEHEAAPLMDQIARSGRMPTSSDLAVCWVDSLGIHSPARRAARLQELEPIADEFLKDLCRALRQVTRAPRP